MNFYYFFETKFFKIVKVYFYASAIVVTVPLDPLYLSFPSFTNNKPPLCIGIPAGLISVDSMINRPVEVLTLNCSEVTLTASVAPTPLPVAINKLPLGAVNESFPGGATVVAEYGDSLIILFLLKGPVKILCIHVINTPGFKWESTAFDGL